ncbi:MAG TPA: flagellar biosynthesis anti-sigma factor FlgM [Bacillales bacterium]|nr:flagellar biosynthesis anti-sigma factor FlgM [Bacillales bacterium]
MKINGVNHSNIHPYKSTQEQAQLNQGVSRRDQLEISPEAKQLLQKSHITAERQEKIDEIKAKVDAGQYKVDPQKTAEKFYDFWKNR